MDKFRDHGRLRADVALEELVETLAVLFSVETYLRIIGALVVVVVSLALTCKGIERFGVGVWLSRVGTAPDYLADFLPGQLLTGARVGLVVPALTASTSKAPLSRSGAQDPR